MNRKLLNEETANIVAAIAFAGVAAWCFWPTLVAIRESWDSNPHHAHGYLVPLIAIWVVYQRRSNSVRERTASSLYAGTLVLALGMLLQLAGAFFYVEPLAAIALPTSVLGLVLLIGGWGIFLWNWPAIAFLLFMLPLPYRLELLLQSNLRSISTVLSAYTLQTLGIGALCEGNVIVIGSRALDVAEACSGLTMFMVFLALASAVAILAQRPWHERLAILLSAIPIAVAANVLRITATAAIGGLTLIAGSYDEIHDAMGLVMMPVALCLLVFEMKLFDYLMTAPAE